MAGYGTLETVDVALHEAAIETFLPDVVALQEMECDLLLRLAHHHGRGNALTRFLIQKSPFRPSIRTSSSDRRRPRL
jgi:hypothetical protein